jgi:hypothetical protein
MKKNEKNWKQSREWEYTCLCTIQELIQLTTIFSSQFGKCLFDLEKSL